MKSRNYFCSAALLFFAANSGQAIEPGTPSSSQVSFDDVQWAGDRVGSKVQIDTRRSTSDSDLDGVNDDLDNCTLAANPDQTDTDADGIGNACDGDFNNDCAVNFLDLGRMKGGFTGADPLLDLNNDGVVDSIDLGILKSGFFAAPGPSPFSTCSACGPLAGNAAEMRFSEQTAAAGLVFEHVQSLDHRAGPMGGGGTVGDFDGDGYPDIFVVGGGGVADALFMNNRDGTFTDRAEAWGLKDLHRGTGATTGDFDGDGDDDLFVTSMGDMESVVPSAGDHRLYRNDGGRFTNVAEQAGVNETTRYADGFGASFGDYDLDGDLDLFVAAWVNVGPGQSNGSRLFRNRGDGTFGDVTAQSGFSSADTFAFGAIFADMDGDRFPELLVAGDFGTTRYYRNDRDGTFTQLDPGTGEPPVLAADPNWSIGKAHNGMGTAVADFDRDGRTDWFVTAIWPAFHSESAYWGNGLYLNQGGHLFVEDTARAGVADGGWGWGVSALDLDNDGWTDIAMTNGWPATDEITGESFSGEQAYLFRNRGDLAFDEIALTSGLSHRDQGRGLLHLDYDLDGDLDVLIFANNSTVTLFRNDLFAACNANWLQVALDTSTRPDLAPRGLGTLITLEVGSETLHAQVTGGGTYLGQSEVITHFGLGSAMRATGVSIIWADGTETVLRNVAANRRLVISPGCPTTDQDHEFGRSRNQPDGDPGLRRCEI